MLCDSTESGFVMLKVLQKNHPGKNKFMNIKKSNYQNIHEFYAWKGQQNFVLKAKKSLAFCLQTVWLIDA